MALVLCPGDRLDVLADQMIAGLASSDDPMVNDLVLVQGAATQRYLSQYVATHNGHGICSGIRFTSIGSLRTELAEAVGLHPDAWNHTALVASIGAVLAERPDWAQPVLDHLATGQTRPGRRIVTVDRLARLFRYYLEHAPAMVRAWNQNQMIRPDPSSHTGEALARVGGAPALTGDASALAGTPSERLPAAHQWQFHLWRAVRADLGPDPDAVNQQVCDVLDDGPNLLDQLALEVPEVLQVVATGALPDPDLALLRALALHREVRVHLLHHRLEGQDPPATTMPADRVLHRLDQELEQTWQQVLAVADRVEPSAPAVRGDSLLGALQRSVLTGTRHRHEVDDSLQVQESHGPDRQVEVLADIVCGLLQDDPTLEPRDIAVVTPSLDRYSALVHQRLVLPGEGLDAHPARTVRLAVQDPRALVDAPVHELVRRVLRLPSTRASAEDLFELCTLPAVSSTFGFGQDEGAALREVIDQAGIRWGIDARHRREFGLATTRQTWFHGLQRLMLGATMASEPVPLARGAGGTSGVPYLDDSRVRLVAALDQFVSVVRKCLSVSQDGLDADGWTEALGEVITQLVGTFGPMAQDGAVLRQRLAQWAAGQSPDARFTRTEIGLVLDELAGRQHPRPSFGTGALVLTTLDQLGAVPHRVVIVLGLDDETFPGPVPVLGDALVDAGACARLRAQQHLCNALMGATQRAILIHQRFDPVTLAEQDRSVAVAEIIDATRAATGARLVPRVWPVQEHDPGNFGDRPQSFDLRAHRAARARANGPAPASDLVLPVGADLLAHQFDLVEPERDRQGRIVLSLTELETFYRNPLRAFLQRRINARLSQFSREVAEELPLVVDGLVRWKAKDLAIRAALVGSEPEDLPAIVSQAGVVPEAEPLDQVQGLTIEAMDYVRALPKTTPTRLQATIATRFGPVHLTGQVPVYRGARFATKTSQVHGDDLLQHWLGALLLAEATGDPVHLVMHSLRGTRRYTSEDPSAHLRWLVELALNGRSHPMALLPRVMHLMAQQPRNDRAMQDAYQRAGKDLDTATFLPHRLNDYLTLPVCVQAAAAPLACEQVDTEQVARTMFDPIQEVRSDPVPS